MKSHNFVRATFVAAASLTVLLPVVGCSNPDTTTPSNGTGSRIAETDSRSNEYEDGTFTERGIYGGAPSYMTITVTLSDDTISDVAVEPMPENNDTSRGYQERFAAAVPEAVIGKSLDEAEVGVLAGASGCADGFNDAIAKIREQARVPE